jgi:SlyX protein
LSESPPDYKLPNGDGASRRAVWPKEGKMKDRLTELEIKTSLTEHLVEELNRAIFRQQQQIDLLQEQLRHLYGRMQANAEPVEARDLRDEIPPHY